jgi:uncharacterized protein (DUF302 family)
MFMHKYLLLGLLCLPTYLFAEAVNTVNNDDTMIVYRAKDDFDTVKLNLETAITDRGITISNTLHIHDMLNRTGKDLGFPNPVYVQAESLEFCSALFAQRIMQANPANIATCPLTIAIYVTVAEPKQVYVAFRIPRLVKSSSALAKELEEWLHGIVRDAVAE